MPKKEFKATQGLLEDDITKQTGRIEKSWLEAVMNSVDAGASWFSIDISEATTEMKDDGSGMDEEEIDLYFQQFGFKDDDSEQKTFGKFRRGRGQIFNFGVTIWHTQDNILVVNIKDETAQVQCPIDFDSADDHVQYVDDDVGVFDTSGLGFNQQKADEYFDGTHITVQHYKELEDVEEKISKFKKLCRYVGYLHDIEIEVNGEVVNSDMEPHFETEYAIYQFGDSSMFADASVYNLGAYVSDFKVTDDNGNRVPLASVVVTKEELRLNNARTEIIEGDELWEQVKEDLVIGARNYLAREGDLNKREAKWLISQAAKNEEIFEDVKGREIIEDINGNMVSLSELFEQDFAFAPKGNAVAREAMDKKDVLMINDSYRDCINALAEDTSDDSGESGVPELPEGKSHKEVIEDHMQFEMKERDEESLTKRRKENLQKIRWFLREVGCYDDVKPGYSKHEDVWRTDPDTILVDEDFLNSNKTKFCTEVLDEVVRIAAADEDTRDGFSTTGSYKTSYYTMMKKSSEPRRKILTGNIDSARYPMLS